MYISEKEQDLSVRISIIIPCYNAQQNIEACLFSIFNLNISHFEVIIVDNCSSDQTISILSDLKFSNLKWVSEPDLGIYDAMNKGIAMALGKFLYFMGADDRLLDGFKCIYEQLKDDHTIYYGNSIPFYEKRQSSDSYGLLEGAFSSYRLAKYCINHQSIVYPAEVFKFYKYDLKYKISADYVLNLFLWGDKRFIKAFFSYDMVSYNMSGFSALNIDHKFKTDKLKIIRKAMGIGILFRYLIRNTKDILKQRKSLT
jgi:glycosyltransferase involved in cell wall biosynthesis